MGTSITVPEHVHARFSKKPQKQNFLPVQSMPHPRPHSQKHLVPQGIASQAPPPEEHRLPIKNLLCNKNPPEPHQHSIDQENSRNVPLPLQQTGREYNSNCSGDKENVKASQLAVGGSSVWKSLSSAAKAGFQQASAKRKLSSNYRSINLIEQNVIDQREIVVKSANNSAVINLEMNKSSFSADHLSAPLEKPLQRRKLKNLYREEQYRSTKRRVQLYLENAENIEL